MGQHLWQVFIIFPACLPIRLGPFCRLSPIFITPAKWSPNHMAEGYGGPCSVHVLCCIFKSLSRCSRILVGESLCNHLTGWKFLSGRWLHGNIGSSSSRLSHVLGFNQGALDLVRRWVRWGKHGLDLEDFILTSNNLLPIVHALSLSAPRYGWGFKNFMAEATMKGKGISCMGKDLCGRDIPALIVLASFIQDMLPKIHGLGMGNQCPDRPKGWATAGTDAQDKHVREPVKGVTLCGSSFCV